MRHDEEERTACDRFREKVACPVTRRLFLRTGVAAMGGMTVVSTANGASAEAPTRFDTEESTGHHHGKRNPKASSFLDLLRVPDGVEAYTRFEKTLPAGTIH